MCNPSGLAGPQPKQALPGAYFSCNDCSGMVPGRLGLIASSNRWRARPDNAATAGRCRASGDESIDCDRAARPHARTIQPRAKQRVGHIGRRGGLDVAGDLFPRRLSR